MSDAKEFFAPIEGLRGIAAILVAMIHLQIFDNVITNSILVVNAGLAVDLFFVISGFVIAHNYIDRLWSIHDKILFVQRRFWRLYPLHLLMLFAYLAFEALRVLVWALYPNFIIVEPGQALSLTSFFSHFFLVQVFTGHTHFYNIPSWSISVEFYLYITLILFLFSRWLKALLILLIASTLLSIYFFKSGTPLDSLGSINFILRGILGFYLGIFVCLIRRENLNKNKFGSIAVFCAYFSIWLGICLFGKTELEIILPFLFALSVYILSQGNTAGLVFRLLSSKLFIYLGSISYSVYMIHSFLWAVLGNFLKLIIPQHSIVKQDLRYFFDGQELLSLIFTLLFLMFLIACSYITFVYVENRFRMKSK